jgi:hypothetical protein
MSSSNGPTTPPINIPVVIEKHTIKSSEPSIADGHTDGALAGLSSATAQHEAPKEEQLTRRRAAGQRRIVSEGQEPKQEVNRKRTRHSAGHLLESLSSLSRRKWREDEYHDHNTTTSRKVAPNGSIRPVALPMLEQSRPESSMADASSSRTSTSGRLSAVSNRDVHLSSSNVVKGKGRASPGVSDNTSWSMIPPRPSFGLDGSPRDSHEQQASRSASQQMDPAALVQMALSLSQSRRLNLAPGQLAPMPGTTGGRRVVSAGFMPANGATQAGYARMGGSTMQRTSGQYAPDVLPEEPSRVSVEREPLPFMSSQAPASAMHSFSLGTLARAEKARVFFELASEYRRLLQNLPPLKPRSDLRNDKAELGRQYNPLQYIRNKQVRAKERQVLDAEASGWSSIERVNVWVDSVETEAQQSEFWSGDVARLPRWTQPTRRRASSTASTTLSERSSIDNKRPTWAKIDWSTQPAQLLADAHWLEQDMHKMLIESRLGDKIFDDFEKPHMTSITEDQWLPDADVTQSPQSRRDSVTQHPFGRTRRLSSPQSTLEDDSGLANVGFSPLARKSKKGKSRGLRLLHRHRGKSSEFTDSSGSEDEHGLHLGEKGSPKFDNTGPLERQMQKMIEIETRNKPLDTLHEMSPASPNPTKDRRGGVSTEHEENGSVILDDPEDLRQPSLAEEPDTSTPRISISSFGPGGLRTASTEPPPATKKKRRGSRFNFFHKQDTSIEDNNIAATDFALRDNKMLSPSDSVRRSLETERSNSYKDLALQHTRSKSGDDAGTASTTGMFFKGGRLGEIVRTERPRMGEFVKRANRNGSISEAESEDRQPSIDVPDSDDDTGRRRGAASRRMKSPSIQNIKEVYYRHNELPTFRSTRREESKSSDRSEDHIARQSQALRNQRRPSRFEDNPLSLQIDADGVSPNTSNVDLSRVDAGKPRGRTTQRSGSKLAPGYRTDDSSSRSPAIQAGRRLNEVLQQPGERQHIRLPVTALGLLQAKNRQEAAQEKQGLAEITSRDVARLRSLLTMTGIKAQIITRRADTVRDPVPKYLIRAAKLSKASLTPVTRRQEHVLAAKLLSQTLEESLAHVTEDAQHFRNDVCTNLHNRLDTLRELLAAKLMPAVRTAGDEADTLVARLTTTHTLSIKQVNDSVDHLMRNRRRRLRFLRNAGFRMLEWLVVGLLWVVWLVVSVLKGVKLVGVGVAKTVGWAFGA